MAESSDDSADYHVYLSDTIDLSVEIQGQMPLDCPLSAQLGEGGLDLRPLCDRQFFRGPGVKLGRVKRRQLFRLFAVGQPSTALRPDNRVAFASGLPSAGVGVQLGAGIHHQGFSKAVAIVWGRTLQLARPLPLHHWNRGA